MRPSRLLTIAGIILGLLLPSSRALVHACSLHGTEQFEIVANPSDQLAPREPTVSLVKVQRGDDWTDDDGCGPQVHSSCDGLAFVLLEVDAQDDTSPSSELGYVIATQNKQLNIPAGPVRKDATGQLMLVFRDISDDGTDDFEATLEISTVDKAGNVSLKSTPITVTNKGSGCRVAPNAPTGLLWTALMLLTLTRRHRRRVSAR